MQPEHPASSGAPEPHTCEQHKVSRGAVAPRRLGLAALVGARDGAILGGGLSTARNLLAAWRGDKTPKEALIESATGCASSALSGAVVGVLGGVGQAAMRGAGLRSLSRSAAPAALGLTAVDIGRDALKLSRGALQAGAFRERVVIHAFRGCTTFLGLELGGALGSLALPLVGGTLGAFAGGTLGYRLGTWLAEPKAEETEACSAADSGSCCPNTSTREDQGQQD